MTPRNVHLADQALAAYRSRGPAMTTATTHPYRSNPMSTPTTPMFRAAGDPPVPPKGGRRKRTYRCGECGGPFEMYAAEKLPDHGVWRTKSGETDERCPGSGQKPASN